MEDKQTLKQENIILREKLDKLQCKYDLLEIEYSENMIIQSMNEMKQRYDTMIKSTVPLYKYKLLTEKHNELIKNYSGCNVLLEHVLKILKSIENNVICDKNALFKAELELLTIKDILEGSISK